MENRIYTGCLNSDIGTICLKADDDFLLSVFLLNGEKEQENANGIIVRAKKELDEYFEGKRKAFNLPLIFDRTPFANDILKTLALVEYGTTLSYSELADASGHKRACRAVGNVVHNNPYLIVVPCHRVVGANGKIGGFALGNDIKIKLLKLEGVYEKSVDQ